tara:strand:- start:899 stop:1147 length:249 start_codon:yes stop_codon:yes gene_type:complete
MSKKENKKKSYFVGPFKEAMDNIDTFGVNMYYSYYYQNAIEEIVNIEELGSIEDADKKSKYYEDIIQLITELQNDTEQSGIE